MKLIIGLGNPGREYEHTHHNIGFLCLDRLAKKLKISFSKRKAKARLARGQVGNEEVILAKPHTFVNRSGGSVADLVKSYKVPLSDLLIIYDDMDLPLGIIRIRAGGSSGGHNGMKSIIAALDGQDFPRLRVGIGHPETGDAIEHVLGRFTAEEERLLPTITETVSEAVFYLIQEGIEAAMDKYNGLSFISKD
jgi:PTH1 family peptidyl-tRNA hydrolase